MTLNEHLIRAHVRGGEVGDQDAATPINDPTEHLLHADVNLPSVLHPDRVAGGRHR